MNLVLAHRSQGLSSPAPLSGRVVGSVDRRPRRRPARLAPPFLLGRSYWSAEDRLPGDDRFERLVQSDSLVGSTSFWLSRPVSARQLLAGKSVFMAGTLIFPTLLVEVLILLFNGVAARDVLRSIPQTLFYTLLAVAILMVLATLTRNLLQMMAFGLVSVGCYDFVCNGNGRGGDLFSWPAGGYRSYGQDYSAKFEVDRVFSVPYGDGRIMVSVQYLTRRTKLNTILTLSALFPCILPMDLWTWDLVAAARKPERTIVDPERFAARIDQQSLKFYEKADLRRCETTDGSPREHCG